MAIDFITFESKGGNTYIYDAPTNTVHPWNLPLSHEFAEQYYVSTDQDQEEAAFRTHKIPEEQQIYLLLWKSFAGGFHSSTPASCPHFESIQQLPAHRLGKVMNADLVLIVSEQCNMRCAYCVFSSFYDSSGYRTHENNFMSSEVAKKAIDLYFEYNNTLECQGYSNRNLNIVFYGGEPLIKFDLIKEIVLYAEQTKRPHQNLVFSASTNLTLLEDKHIDFFIDHDIHLSVSFDGPIEEHDRYRTLKNDDPSAELVLSNLKKMKEKNEAYYSSKISLLVTINGNSNLQSIMNFFDDNLYELPPIKIISFLKDLESSAFHQAYPFDRNLYHRRINNIYEFYFEQKLKGARYKPGQFLYRFIEEGLEEMYRRLHSFSRQSQDWYTGTCAPGRKMAISPDGTISMCERVNNSFPIGHVNTGIEEKLQLQVLNEYFQNCPDCGKCWARNLCNLCIAATCCNDGFEVERRCKDQKSSILEGLHLLYSILERKPRAFDSEDGLLSS